MRKTIYTFCIFISLLLICCSNPQPEAPDLLRQAEQLVDSNPDSAMLLIDSIHYPEKSLEHGQYMHYLVMRVQMRYKNYRDIAGDTLVFDAARYFARKEKDPGQAALACFYSGCVRREQGRLDPAMRYYKDAERYAQKAKDANLQGLIQFNIGDLLNEQGLYDKAIANYKNAVQCYRELPEKQAQALSAVGRMFLLTNNTDSAFYYLHKGMELANHTDDNALQSLLAQNLSIAYNREAHYSDAEKYLRQSFVLNQDSADLPRYYLNFANLYSNMGQTDSANYYTKMLKQHAKTLDNNYFKASAYSYLADWEKKQTNYDTAFSYQEKYIKIIEGITKTRLQKSVFEIQRKYDYEREKNLQQKQLNQKQYWIIVLLTTIIAGGAVFTWYTIRQKNRFLHIRTQMETLRQIADKLEQSHAGRLALKEENLRGLLLWKFDVVKKAILLSNDKSATEKKASSLIADFQKIVYNNSVDDQWMEIHTVFNEVNKDIGIDIRIRYPKLSETEYRITLLSYAEMSVKEIAVILGLNANTIQSYRRKIRKKIGVNDISVDTGKYLRDYYSSKNKN